MIFMTVILNYTTVLNENNVYITGRFSRHSDIANFIIQRAANWSIDYVYCNYALGAF